LKLEKMNKKIDKSRANLLLASRKNKVYWIKKIKHLFILKKQKNRKTYKNN